MLPSLKKSEQEAVTSCGHQGTESAPRHPARCHALPSARLRSRRGCAPVGEAERWRWLPWLLIRGKSLSLRRPRAEERSDAGEARAGRRKRAPTYE